MNDEINYHGFVMRLLGLHKASESVLVFFTCNRNRAGRIAFNQGEIVSFRYANKKGNEGLTSMAGIEHVKFRLEMLNVQLPRDDNLANTNTVIKQLLVYEEGVDFDTVQNIQQASPTKPEQTATQAEAPAASISESQKKLIEKNLIKIIGPMGSFLCKKHVHQASSFNQALDGLATELSSDEVNTLKQMLSMIE